MEPTHILRRNPRSQTVRQLHAEASEELNKLAPVAELGADPKWLRLMEHAVSKVITDLEQMKGLSDPNRYKFNTRSVDEAFKAMFDKLCETDEAFRQRQGNKEVFRFGSS